MARLIPVERRGKVVWVMDGPDICPAGHGDGMLPVWRSCPTCGSKDSAWECQRHGCGATAMDWDHRCDAPQQVGRGYPRRGGSGL